MEDNAKDKRYRVRVSREQEVLLKEESERCNLSEWLILKEIFDLGFEAYFSVKEKDKNRDSNEVEFEEEKPSENLSKEAMEKLDEIMQYAKKSAELSYGILAGHWYVNYEKIRSIEGLLKQNNVDYNEYYNALKFISGSGPAAMALMYEKVGAYMLENGGDVMNAYWQFCKEHNVHPAFMFLTMDAKDWAKFEKPTKDRPIAVKGDLCYRQVEWYDKKTDNK